MISRPNVFLPLLIVAPLLGSVSATALGPLPKPETVDELRANAFIYGKIIEEVETDDQTDYYTDLDGDRVADRQYTDYHDVGEPGSIEDVAALTSARPEDW